MMQLLLIFITIISILSADAQDYIHKYVENISSRTYKGDIQIWDIEPTSEGYVFFATGTALCVWDGTRWDSYTGNGERYFRSLAYDPSSKRLYASGNNTFGYWISNNYGNFEYTELFYNTNVARGSIFWRTIIKDSQIYFQTHESILRYDTVRKVIDTLPTIGYVNYIHKLDDQIYAQIDSKFYEIRGVELLELPFSIDSRIVYISRHNDLLYLFSETRGIMIFRQGILEELDSQLNRKLIESRVFSANRLTDGKFAIGTVLDGLYIIDASGRIIEHHNENQQMEYTTVLSVEIDSLNNLWLGLDGSLAKIDANSRQGYFRSLTKRIGGVYAVCEDNDRLILGTNKGLYIVHGNQQPQFVGGTEGQVWDINKFGEHILVSHDKGLYQLIGTNLEKLHSSSWQIQTIPGRAELFYSADDGGFSIYQLRSGKVEYRNRLENYNGQLNNSFIDKFGALWVYGLNGKVKRLSIDAQCYRVEKEADYPVKGEENEWIGACILDNEVVFFCQNRCYTYDTHLDCIVANPYYTSLMDNIGTMVHKIVQLGNHFFYIGNNEIGVIERSAGEFLNKGLIFTDIYNSMIPVAFRSVIALSENRIAIGFNNGVAFYDCSKSVASFCPPLQLRRIEYTHRGNSEQVDLSNIDKVLRFENGTVNIRFLLTNTMPDGIVYTMLDRSRWLATRINDAFELPYINSGSHTLCIKRSLQDESQIEIRFEVAYPLTSTIGFWLSVFVLIIVICSVTYRIYLLRLQKEKQQILEKERMNFENQRLSLEVKDRDKRLTSFAMNSIHFNNMLNDIQGEITEIKTNDPILKSHLHAIIRKITQHRRNENNWEIFEKYFNNVYDGFFDKLATNHPNLTPNDMKIAAYIKLGLTTKEIAVLMNISPGSVDTARHRLRKNLQLGGEVSLSEYLSKI